MTGVEFDRGPAAGPPQPGAAVPHDFIQRPKKGLLYSAALRETDVAQCELAMTAVAGADSGFSGRWPRVWRIP